MTLADSLIKSVNGQTEWPIRVSYTPHPLSLPAHPDMRNSAIRQLNAPPAIRKSDAGAQA